MKRIFSLFTIVMSAGMANVAQAERYHFHYEGVVYDATDHGHSNYLYEQNYAVDDVVSGTLTIDTQYLSSFPPREEIHENWFFGTTETRYFNQPAPTGNTEYFESSGDQRLVTGLVEDVGSSSYDRLLIRDLPGADYLRVVDGFMIGDGFPLEGRQIKRPTTQNYLYIDFSATTNFVNGLALGANSFEPITLTEANGLSVYSKGAIVSGEMNGIVDESTRGPIEPYQSVSFKLTSVTIEVAPSESHQVCLP